MSEFLNSLIIDHLRHYGFTTAARIFDNELKEKTAKIVDNPSKLEHLLNSASALMSRENDIKGGVGPKNFQKNIDPAKMYSVLVGGSGNTMIKGFGNQGNLSSEKKQKPVLPQTLSEETEKEIDKNQLIKKELEREISRVTKKEDIICMFSYDELGSYKTKYLDSLDRSVFMNRDQFIDFLPKINQISNIKLLDKIFLHQIKLRPKVMGPKIPLNCLTFQECLELIDCISIRNPIKLFSYFARMASEEEIIQLDRLFDTFSSLNVGIYTTLFKTFLDALKHFSSKNPKLKSFTLETFFNEVTDFGPILTYF